MKRPVKAIARKEKAARLALFAVLAFQVFGIYLFVKEVQKFLKLGKDKKLKNLAGVWEPPTDLDPGMVHQLLKANKTLDPKVFTAIVISLVHKKVFKLTRSDKKEGFVNKQYRYFLERTNFVVEEVDKGHKGARLVDLSKNQKAVYKFLMDKVGQFYLEFYDKKESKWSRSKYLSLAVRESKEGERRRIPLDKVSKYIKTYPSISYGFFKDLEKDSFKESLDQGYFDQDSS